MQHIVQHCWVKDFGKYKQGKQLGNLVPKKENFAKNHYSLRKLFENCVLLVDEMKMEIYTAKSYIHKRYNCNNNSIWNANN
jgi:hypothetical protein